MDTITQTTGSFSDIIFNAGNTLFGQVGDFLPALLGAILLVILGLIIAKAVRGLIGKILDWTGLGNAADNSEIDTQLREVGLKNGLVGALKSFIYWIILLIFLIAAFEAVGLGMVVDTLSDLVAYLPNIIIAGIIAVLAVALARFVKRFILAALEKMQAGYARFVAIAAEILIIIFGLTMALSQLQIDISLITNNLTAIIIGAIALLVLSLGLGSRNLSANVLAGYYVRKAFKTGQKVNLAGHTGMIKEITTTAVILQSSEGDVVVPHDQIMRSGSHAPRV